MTNSAIADKDKPFLKKVMDRGNLPDLFDARDITVVVFRTMRDLMDTKAADQVAGELQKEAFPTDKKALQDDIADLWRDNNPIVAFLSRVRPPLKIDSELFLRRVNQEAGIARGIEVKTVIKAVFSATKEELSPERVAEIGSFLPDKIRQIWQEA